MTDHTPTRDVAPSNPDLARLNEAIWLTEDDEYALRDAAEILAGQADDMVTGWRATLADQPWRAGYSRHPDGPRNPEQDAAAKPQFDRWIIDAYTRSVDQGWPDYQHGIGPRRTWAERSSADGVDSPDQVPQLRLLAFADTVISAARDHLAAAGAAAGDVDRMHAAFTKWVMLQVTVLTQSFADTAMW